MKVKNKITGAFDFATYAANSSGNMRYWVAGRFWRDGEFDRNWEIVKE